MTPSAVRVAARYLTALAKKPPKPKKLTPDYLLEVGMKARERVMPGRDAENGDCEPVSDEVVRLLQKAGYKDAQTVYGSFQGHPHTWAVVGGYKVDATRDQFRHFAEDPEEEEEFLDHPVVVERE